MSIQEQNRIVLIMSIRARRAVILALSGARKRKKIDETMDQAAFMERVYEAVQGGTS